jgi:type IV secretory pathway VirB3-like protein
MKIAIAVFLLLVANIVVLRDKRYFTALLIAIALVLVCSGCAAYSKTGAWAPNGLNYTLSRDRQTGDLTDYFGVSWQLK